MAKRITLDVAEGRISWHRDTACIDAEALTDGIYVISTRYRRKPSARRRRLLLAAGQPRARLRSIKADDLDLRPIWHRLEDRIEAHILICYLTWHQAAPRSQPR